MFTNSYRDTCLAGIDGFIGLFTAISSWRTPTVTETAYTGYGNRPASGFGSAGNTSPTGGRQVSNGSTVTFGQNTSGSSVDLLGFGVFSANSGGTLRAIGCLDADPPVLGVAYDTSSELIAAPAHGLSADQRVFVLAAPGAVIPTGLSEGTAYFVLASGLTVDEFKLSTTSGGSAVNITAKGAALFIPYTVVTIVNNATPEFGAGTLIVQM